MTTDLDKSARAVKKLGYQLGFDLVGITSADPLTQPGQRLRQAIDSGCTAEMHYLKRNPTQRSHPKSLFPWASSIISVGISYHWLPLGPPQSHHLVRLSHSASPNLAPFSPTKDCQTPPPSRTPNPHQPLISRYALGRDYHLVLAEKLKLFKDELQNIVGREFRNRLAVDTLAIMEKPLAQRAGLGWQGKNSLLINPKFGSWIFLGELLTELDLTPDAPGKNQCGNCTACIDACPTGALSELGLLDARKCLSYLTIEHKGDFPLEILETIKAQSKRGTEAQRHKGTKGKSRKDTEGGERYIGQCAVYGCDICQEVCPFNQDTPRTKEPQFYPPDEILNLSLDDLRSMSQTRFEKVFCGGPIARLSYQQFLRNLQLLEKT